MPSDGALPSRISVTKRVLDKLPRPTRDTVLWDFSLKGFGVRVSAEGRMSFVVQYRNPQGRSRRITIGPYGAYTPEKARNEADRLLSEARGARHGWADAKDPAERRQEERRAITFKQLADEYIEKAEKGLVLSRRSGKSKKPGTIITDKYRIEHLKRHFGDKALKNIHRGDCQRCLETLIAGKHGAARTYGLLGGVLNYAMGQGYIANNPARGVTTPADGMRDFRLDANGYLALGEVLKAADARLEPWQALGAIRLIALTGARRGEVLKLRLNEIDFDDRCLRLGNTKSGEDVAQNVRPLGEAALELLKALVNRGGRPASPWLFPGRNPKKPFNGLGDRHIGAWSRIIGDGYTPHSLRHAFASACHDLGLSELTIAYLLGHADARTGTVTRRYIKPDAVLLAAADKISGYISDAMAGTTVSAESGNAMGA